ncbi:MAG: cupin domain-containing protein [Phycisphaerae bacterium]|nr:cupin domain-containing protein [Phycisphaerae bacterium]MDW8262859.1 cupin domain-containing protein [Phycisphaerales bacterium]
MSASEPARPLGLIGGIGLTEVTVYSQRPGPDGTFSGCPHVHAVTDEAYYVLRGTGRVEFHDLQRGPRVVPLREGDYLQFPPLVLHRLVSESGLVVLGLMGNAGLAERGDARIYFGPDVDADATRYDQLKQLPNRLGLEGALQRRDLAVQAYMRLQELAQTDRQAYFGELSRFFEVHRKTMLAQVEELSRLVTEGPSAWAESTRRRLRELASPLRPEGSILGNRSGSESALGMCGTLRTILQLEQQPQ